MTVTVADRILGCLKGIATGDAIGKQTETLSHEGVLHWYPHGIRGFEGTPGSVIPRYVGNAKREWRIGETTDDTEMTVAVARAILTDRNVSHVSIGRELLRCTKCVHPGLKSLWEFHQAGDPARVARNHDGCGAAIRVAPVGILYASHRSEELLHGAREASVSTHGGSLARSLRPPVRGRGPHSAPRPGAHPRHGGLRDSRASLSESAFDDRAVGAGTRYSDGVSGRSDPRGREHRRRQ